MSETQAVNAIRVAINNGVRKRVAKTREIPRSITMARTGS